MSDFAFYLIFLLLWPCIWDIRFNLRRCCEYTCQSASTKACSIVSHPQAHRTLLGIPQESLKYHTKFQMPHKISRKFLTSSCRYWSNLCALPTASLLCFGQCVYLGLHLVVLCLCSFCIVTEPLISGDRGSPPSAFSDL
jgi:hypothetical protein